jgi:hypothetical protein
MEFRMTFGDLNGSSEDRRDAINEAIQMADQNPRADKLVLPQGWIDVATGPSGLEYFVTGDVSAALEIQGQGGDSFGTVLRGVGPASDMSPTIKIGTDGGGNFRRCPLRGVTIQRRGIEFSYVGYGVFRDMGFHGIIGPSITANQSYLRFESCIAQHCEQLYRGTGGSVQFANSKLGEDLGGLELFSTKARLIGCEGHSLKSSHALRHDSNGNPWGVRPWITATGGSSVHLLGCDFSVLPNSSEPTAAENICDTFMLTDRVRDILIGGGATIGMGKATSFITMRFQNSGTEPGAACVVGDDVIVTSDLDAGQKFTAFDSLFGTAGSGFDKAKFAGTIEVRDTTEAGFEWGAVALGQGLITSGAQVRLNTD